MIRKLKSGEYRPYSKKIDPKTGSPREKRATRPPAHRRAAGTYWSQAVTESSRALELDEGVFTWDDPKKIAQSLKRSAERSTARKTTPFRSALSMLTFYINRAGRGLSEERRTVLESAKDELRKAFGRV
jgi:hypothetical protein